MNHQRFRDFVFAHLVFMVGVKRLCFIINKVPIKFKFIDRSQLSDNPQPACGAPFLCSKIKIENSSDDLVALG